ncbi:hypothetical protein [Amycolatopsis regifaucium]|uniref:Uncharacterized protein n=1 Tax=Amycolatopsis regifaucium TaxID=546365 RepID=A0A154MEI1_9PSEU|nr:hypothetical protein [Amycolatopsis regifaucium]KZB82902.1 hypothetical protein AVL48_37270 [Amycolatopsis regifaucium]OKA03347.1 hypothetical protein ATP06_0236690 [Amycolatopsis regifaucium]SFJ68040.1 hypothetical protein SAMN04489731_13023 [Amycolatopsis regifaucium]
MTYLNDPREPQEEIVEQTPARIRVVRVVNAIVHAVCWIFALVLIVHILLVFGEANPGNGFAQLIDGWSRGVSLGLRNLFTPDGAKLRTLLNDGLAALLWLIIGGVVTDLVSRIGLPGPKRVWYRRTLR